LQEQQILLHWFSKWKLWWKRSEIIGTWFHEFMITGNLRTSICEHLELMSAWTKKSIPEQWSYEQYKVL
jgi:hypothetical protein